GVHPTLEPRVQPEAYHPAQPRSVPLHQLRPAPGVAGGGLLDKSLDIAGVGTHGDHHTTLIGARAALVTEYVEKTCSSRATAAPGGAMMIVSARRKSTRLRLPPCFRGVSSNGPENWNSATRQVDKCRTAPGRLLGPIVVTRDGVALFDIGPTVTN